MLICVMTHWMPWIWEMLDMGDVESGVDSDFEFDLDGD